MDALGGWAPLIDEMLALERPAEFHRKLCEFIKEDIKEKCKRPEPVRAPPPGTWQGFSLVGAAVFMGVDGLPVPRSLSASTTSAFVPIVPRGGAPASGQGSGGKV